MSHIGDTILIMTLSQFQTNIPEDFKEDYWIKGIDENENQTYTVRTWEALTVDPVYMRKHGITPYVLNASWDGEQLGNCYMVSIMPSNTKGQVGAVTAAYSKFLNLDEADEFRNQ